MLITEQLRFGHCRGAHHYVLPSDTLGDTLGDTYGTTARKKAAKMRHARLRNTDQSTEEN